MVHKIHNFQRNQLLLISLLENFKIYPQVTQRIRKQQQRLWKDVMRMPITTTSVQHFQ